jgi:hypothetical protein
MDSKYPGFLEANPTFRERVEAFTSGLLTPDPKVVVLWSMEQGGVLYGGRTAPTGKGVRGGIGCQFPARQCGRTAGAAVRDGVCSRSMASL